MGNDLILSPTHMWFPGNIYNQLLLQPPEQAATKFCVAQTSTPLTVHQLREGLQTPVDNSGLFIGFAVAVLALAVTAIFAPVFWRFS